MPFFEDVAIPGLVFAYAVPDKTEKGCECVCVGNIVEDVVVLSFGIWCIPMRAVFQKKTGHREVSGACRREGGVRFRGFSMDGQSFPDECFHVFHRYGFREFSGNLVIVVAVCKHVSHFTWFRIIDFLEFGMRKNFTNNDSVEEPVIGGDAVR